MTAAPPIEGVSRPGEARPVTPIGILATRLFSVLERIELGGHADVDVIAELRALGNLAAGLESYAAQCTSPESGELRDLAARTAGYDWSVHHGDGAAAPLEQEMLSGHVEGRFLAMLVHVTRCRQVLDIGMFTGYSALAMAQALPPDGRVVACEIDAQVATEARAHFAASSAGSLIDVRTGPALDTLRDLADSGQAFDLVFVDADKAGYRGYVDTVLERGLLATHGVICVDNTLMQGLPWTDATATPNAVAIADFNAAIAADPRVEQVLLPVRDGITLIRRAGD